MSSSSIKASSDSTAPMAVQSPFKITFDFGPSSSSFTSGTPSNLSSSFSTASSPVTKSLKVYRRSGSNASGSRKVHRMSHDLLVDALLDAFKEFKFWPLRMLNERLRQPKVYLLEILETIAVLNKGGRYDGTYKLKPEALEWISGEDTLEY